MPLATKLRELIDASHDGSVNDAAKAMGIPQPTLAQIVGGKVKSPRTRVLQAIATFYGVTVDWLLLDGALSDQQRRGVEQRMREIRWHRAAEHVERVARQHGLAVERCDGRLTIRAETT